MPDSLYPLAVLTTGQQGCFDRSGEGITCRGSGQDGESRTGVALPQNRFRCEGDLVRDELTSLSWARDASVSEFPLMWQEAIEFVGELNHQRYLGYQDWRLPARSELLSLLDFQQTRPPLPAGHPFVNIFPSWYWSSTSYAGHPDHAWYLNLDGGRLFYGGKTQSFMVWPVRGKSRLVMHHQMKCYDDEGNFVPCAESGQDGEQGAEANWPEPRFLQQGDVVLDCWSGLQWRECVDLSPEPVSWKEALALVASHATELERPWRLPNINELESLVDLDRANPAVRPEFPIHAAQAVYWSSTTSLYEPDWAWALYLDKGAIGVGQKSGRHFHVMAVR